MSGRALATSNLNALVVLGSQPLVPSDPALHDQIFTTIGQAFPAADAIVMGSVPVDSFLWRHCHESPAIQQQSLVYIPNGVRSCHTIPLPKSFDEYLAKLGAKRRYNLRRQVRKLGDFAKNTLELRRITAPADVPLLLDALDAIKRGLPWDPNVDRAAAPPSPSHAAFVDLAGTRAPRLLSPVLREAPGRRRHRHAVRAHVLAARDGARPVALPAVSGQHDALHGPRGSRGASRRRWSTSATASRRYRHRSTNIAIERGLIVLLKKTFANRLRRTGHAAFQSGVTLLKQLFRGPRPRLRRVAPFPVGDANLCLRDATRLPYGWPVSVPEKARRRILIVEDEDRLRETLHALLGTRATRSSRPRMGSRRSTGWPASPST